MKTNLIITLRKLTFDLFYYLYILTLGQQTSPSGRKSAKLVFWSIIYYKSYKFILFLFILNCLLIYKINKLNNNLGNSKLSK